MRQPEFRVAHRSPTSAPEPLAQPSMHSVPNLLVAPRATSDAAFRRGLALHRAGRIAEAVSSYGLALRSDPGHFDANYLLGSIATEEGEYERAAALFGRAVRSRPEHADARNCEGVALRKLGRAAEALACFERALELRPDHAEFHNNRGNALADLERPAEAVAAYDRAIESKPRYPKAHFNRGNALRDLGRPQEAITSYRSALSIAPDYADAHANLADALCEIGDHTAALEHFEAAAASDPPDFDPGPRTDSGRDPAGARLHLGIRLLQAGDFARGWQLFEWRHRIDRNADAQAMRLGSLPWRGAEPLEGKTIVLFSEQGLGDTIQFSRYGSLLAERGATVLLQVQAPLAGLLRTVRGVHATLTPGEVVPAHDFHCPLMSVAGAIGTELHTVPAFGRYLAPDPAKVAEWADRLGPRRGPRIGLAWSGNPAHKGDVLRSIALAEFGRLMLPGLEYVSLQKDVRAADRAVLERCGMRDFAKDLHDFSDTAALCAQVDLVIAVDTSVAHLAGALGRPVWILLQFDPDFRWLLGRADSPWYPSATLYRQDPSGEWPEVLARVAADLRRRFDRCEPARNP
jgi:tetratricopeptide (TPR) repeat protein